MPNIPMVDLKGQMEPIKSKILDSFEQVLTNCDFIKGSFVCSFAENLANYLGNNTAIIPCANGTDALQIALMALDLKPGDEVITTPFTFVSTAEVIALLGLKPIFVDVHPDTMILDEHQLESLITERTRCIIPVHLFGQGANMAPIMQLAEKYNLYVVEDNAQAIGADYTNEDGSTVKYGTIGHIGCTSFFPSKNLGCYGDGGAIFCSNEALTAKIQQIVDHGSSVRYYHDVVGVNSRLDTLQAAVLEAKLPYLDDYNQSRREAALRYNEYLEEVSLLKTPFEAPYSSHVYHQYTLQVKDGQRDKLAKGLQEIGIPHGIYYPVPLHLQKAYQHYGYKEGQFPISEQLSRDVISLPMHTELTMSDQAYITKAIKNIIQ